MRANLCAGPGDCSAAGTGTHPCCHPRPGMLLAMGSVLRLVGFMVAVVCFLLGSFVMMRGGWAGLPTMVAAFGLACLATRRRRPRVIPAAGGASS